MSDRPEIEFRVTSGGTNGFQESHTHVTSDGLATSNVTRCTVWLKTCVLLDKAQEFVLRASGRRGGGVFRLELTTNEFEVIQVLS